MRTLGLVLIVVLALAIFAFFVPVFPISQTSSGYFGASQGTVTADVSLTFLISHCGSYVNAQYTATFLGLQSTQPISKGYDFACNFQVTSSS